MMSAQTSGRPHVDRIRFDLGEIRKELIQTTQELGHDGFLFAPRTGLRSCKSILQEIGVMEAVSRHMAQTGESLDWETLWQSMEIDDLNGMMTALNQVRTDTLAFLEECTEERMETPAPLPEAWSEYFGGITVIEPEELLRWIVRHEYYHLGQLNIYAAFRAETVAS